MWKIDGPEGLESDKIAALVVPYTRGRGLDVGCGQRKVWPHCIGIDNGHHDQMFGHQTVCDFKSDGSDLSVFSDNSMDFVFSSHTLEHFPDDKVEAVLAEWARVIKPGGYLVLYLPSANLYPKIGEKGANPDHKWDIYPGDVERRLQLATKCGWTQLECEERGTKDDNEYSLYEVYKKREDGIFEKKIWERNPQGKKRCLVIRYGAIGDQIIAASILPQLQKQGYYVTYNVSTESQDILRHDPHIDEFLLQDTNQVPNMQLGAYWKSLELSKRYDKIINLCESIEGSLLTLHGRLTNEYSHGARHNICNVNYLERTHDIADVPHKFSPKFYPTEAEIAEAKKEIERCGGAPIIHWALNGSSVHKVYPWVQIVAAWLIEKTPAHIYFTGDLKDGKLLQDAIILELQGSKVDTSRIHAMAGIWPIRTTLTFAQHADIVVGPETGVLNAVSMADMPKVVYLSHSSIENLTKHWKNTRSLTPEEGRCPCYPCHRLITGWEYCNKNEKTAAAQCASSITPERVFGAIAKSLIKQVEKSGKAA